MASLSFSELVQTRAFRRAVAFSIGIGGPAVAGLYFHQSGGLLVGVVTAVMFGFADDEGPLSQRFTALGRAAAGVALGGAIGHVIGGYGPLFWVVFMLGAFSAAWLNRAGKTAHIGARLAVMALIITAGTPEMSRVEVLFVVGSLTLATLLRLADHAIYGSLPASTLPPRQGFPESERFWLRFCTAYAAAATLALWLGLWVDPQHAIWVVITTLVVMQPDDRKNYRRILERAAGTAAGVIAAYVLTRFAHSTPFMVALLLVTAIALPHHMPLRYWLHTAAIALLVMLGYDLASQASPEGSQFGSGLFTERLIDVLVGCFMALVGTEIGFQWGKRAPPKTPG
jgi:uncharacterized membrane protein YccC